MASTYENVDARGCIPEDMFVLWPPQHTCVFGFVLKKRKCMWENGTGMADLSQIALTLVACCYVTKYLKFLALSHKYFK